MAGISSIITNLRNEFASVQSFARKRFSEQEKRLDELEARLDRLDRPAQSQTGVEAKKAAKKRLSAQAKAKKVAKKRPRRPVPMPVPDRPEIMKEAGVGIDPR